MHRSRSPSQFSLSKSAFSSAVSDTDSSRGRIAQLVAIAKTKIPKIDRVVISNFIYNFITFLAAILVLVMSIVLIGLSAFIYKEVSHISYRFNQLGDLSTEQLVLIVIVLVIELVLVILQLVGRRLPTGEVLKLQRILATGTGANKPTELLKRLVAYRDSEKRIVFRNGAPDTATSVIEALKGAQILL